MAFTSINLSDLEWALTSTDLPGTGGANRLEPSSGLKTVGVDFEEFINCEEVNWMFYKIYKALEELDSRTVVAGQLPVGSIYTNVSSSVNPATLLGYGTWTPVAGRAIIGAGTITDARGETKTFTAGETGGEVNHVLTIAEMPSHNHTGVARWDGANVIGEANDNEGNQSASDYTGGNQPHNNMMPYQVAYMWQRTA